MKIKDLHRIELPREKLEKYSEQKLSDAELLAIVLGSGIKGINVLELANKIISLIRKEKEVSLEKLLSIKGLGKAKALQICAVLALGKRFENKEVVKIFSPKDIWKLCEDFRESKREHFVAFYLDTHNKLIERHIISIGTLNASLVHPREVFEPAIRLSAASIIVAHNHPSGVSRYSSEDIEITRKLIQAGKILGIGLQDHVIVTKSGYESIIRYCKI